MRLESGNLCGDPEAPDHELHQAGSLVTFISPNPPEKPGRNLTGRNPAPEMRSRDLKRRALSPGGGASFGAVTPLRSGPHPASLRPPPISIGCGPW